VSVELAESGQVSAGGWLERLGTCKPTKRGPTTFVGEQVGWSLMQECDSEGMSL
jgi:hypothetical protein